MVDSVLINTPVSSPLHAQLNLPLLKSHLQSHGFSSRVMDTNIAFYREFLGDEAKVFSRKEYDENPIRLLDYYNHLEESLFERSKAYDGLHVGLRSLAMKQDRLFFSSVLEAIGDRRANPFIDFYERLVDQAIIQEAPRIVGIAVTFQDQIIPAFTLASVLRQKMPNTIILFGGQMITRCYDSMLQHEKLCQYIDYLALWDGEVPLLNLHKSILRNETIDSTNLLDVKAKEHKIDRAGASLPQGEIPKADYSDIPFSDYLFPEFLVPLQTTRGCYASCAFCAIPYGSNKYQVRQAEKVIDEILEIQEITQEFGHKATYFKFMEDTSSPSLLLQVARLIKERNIDAKWETFARFEDAFAKPGMMEELFEGGCRKIHWGLETNDPDILIGMNKNASKSHTNDILEFSAKAGVMNFCFVLVGFPGETDEARANLGSYIINNPYIHTLTISTFDLTRKSPMERNFIDDNPYGLDRQEAADFQVRLPYTVDGQDWKRRVVPAAHKLMIDIVRERPDIGFVTLFPDQVRAMLTDKHGPDWGRKFVERYGEENVQEMLVNTERYVAAYEDKEEIDIQSLPEPLKREHFRTKEDMALLAQAVLRRRAYEKRRIEQV